jgi:cell wall-associated NlpC family hydrolase
MSDPRLTLVRDGVAALSLLGQVRADRYEPTSAARCVVAAAAIRKAADAMSEQQDQVIFGEAFDILFEEQGFAFGQARRDGYVGFVETTALAKGLIEPSHWISVLRTYAFAEPDLKTATTGLYTLNSLVTVEQTYGRFAKIADGGWLFAAHLAPIGDYGSDPAGVAALFLNAPYQWGGRESAGLDCSGLIQQALYACGHAGPRDTDMQAEALGRRVARDELRRNDLVFWRGHVGIMLDEDRLLHANAHHMMTAIEPVGEAIARISSAGAGEPTAFKRLGLQ